LTAHQEQKKKKKKKLHAVKHPQMPVLRAIFRGENLEGKILEGKKKKK
jgi:hypothetical protein